MGGESIDEKLNKTLMKMWVIYIFLNKRCNNRKCGCIKILGGAGKLVDMGWVWIYIYIYICCMFFF